MIGEEKIMATDADRYIWLIAHMGIVERAAKYWSPIVHEPLLKYLQDNIIDKGVETEGPEWIERQRELLK